MQGIPAHTSPHQLLQMVPQEVLGRAFVASGVHWTEDLQQLAATEIERLADAARQFMVMGANWNRPCLEGEGAAF